MPKSTSKRRAGAKATEPSTAPAEPEPAEAELTTVEAESEAAPAEQEPAEAELTTVEAAEAEAEAGEAGEFLNRAARRAKGRGGSGAVPPIAARGPSFSGRGSVPGQRQWGNRRTGG